MRAEENIKEKRKMLNLNVSSKLKKKTKAFFQWKKNQFSVTAISQWEGSVM